MSHIILYSTNLLHKPLSKLPFHMILIVLFLCFINHNIFPQTLKKTPYINTPDQIKKDKSIIDTYNDTQNKRRPNNVYDGINNISNSSNNFGVFNSQLGKDISNEILTLELKALDLAYAIDDPKLFTLTIKNISSERYTIHLSDNYVHNIFFDVHNEVYMPPSIPTSLVVERNNDYVSYRSITLEPNEYLTMTVDLSKYVSITESGVYKVVARFYPEKYIDVSQRGFSKSKSQHYIESKALLISIMNVKHLKRDYEVNAHAYTDIYNNVKLITREYSPYDVVDSALSALKNKNWDIFFSYVDIHDLFINSVSTSDTFNLLSTEEKQTEITQFIKRIKNAGKINDLHPPELFTIDETQYTSYNAHVEVSVRIPEKNSILLYRYNFYLVKKSNGWKITNYNIAYLGLDSINTVKRFLGNTNDYVSPSEF